MKRTQFKHLAATVAALSAFLVAGAASAQYVWVDEKGVKQFSDMPPPPTVPPSRILKQPRGAASAAPAPGTAGTAPDAAPSSGPPAMTTAEKNAEFRKRRMEQAEKEKKAADEAKAASDKSKNCERARDYQRALESGERLSRTDRNGERAFLTDEQREQELRETRRILQECK